MLLNWSLGWDAFIIYNERTQKTFKGWSHKTIIQIKNPMPLICNSKSICQICVKNKHFNMTNKNCPNSKSKLRWSEEENIISWRRWLTYLGSSHRTCSWCAGRHRREPCPHLTDTQARRPPRRDRPCTIPSWWSTTPSDAHSSPLGGKKTNMTNNTMHRKMASKYWWWTPLQLWRTERTSA